ncbi:hypothetical protein GCM10022198_09970 [Klugiella xanthotipulae]|uniref:DUF2304 domain-containing protein n=1 Tax=Klugiella xanthotipulae TaxID=244735 RepID=A0A543HYS0_9MICO|nr:DUF2304 domain-containing protein [Klugiella xanthotipulae]TQM63395.1 hypothetical protein FB466_1657 [Klugiella xanthotipulae]
MTVTSYIFGIFTAVITLGVVIEMLRRNRLRERHAVWWLFGGALGLVIGIFPGSLEWAASVIGIEVPTNLVFFVSIALLVLVCIQHSSELTRLEDKTRILAEESALLAVRVRELETATGTGPGRLGPHLDGQDTTE